MIHPNLGDNAQLELMTDFQGHVRHIGQLISVQPNLLGHLRVVGLGEFEEGRLQAVCVAQQMVLVGQHEDHLRVDVAGTGQIGGTFGGQ